MNGSRWIQEPVLVLALAFLSPLLAAGRSGGQELIVDHQSESREQFRNRAIGEVKDGLQKEDPPWYDQDQDQFDLIEPPADRSSEREFAFDWSFPTIDLAVAEIGRLLTFVILAVLLLGLVFGIARSWNQWGNPDDLDRLPKGRVKPREASKVGSLLPGVFDVAESNPMEAARRAHLRGELDRAIILLFAHLLLLLDQHGLVRLAPGRTGRQLVRSIADQPTRKTLQNALRMFEEIYYGHHHPDPLAFETLWVEAEALDRKLRSKGNP